jgi:hypothetical protein
MIYELTGHVALQSGRVLRVTFMDHGRPPVEGLVDNSTLNMISISLANGMSKTVTT